MRPSITGSSLKDLSVAPGQAITLQVKFEGTPCPSIKWTKDGRKLSKSDFRTTIKEEETSSELTISRAVPSDAGTYQISLKNNVGKVEASCNVVVGGK